MKYLTFVHCGNMMWMISFVEALNIVLDTSFLSDTEGVDLLDSLGRSLAQNVISDVDMPPFDKSAMDGFACRREDLTHELEVLETIPAGTIPTKPVGTNQCSRIMTGAMIPAGADCVIKVEETRMTPEGRVLFSAGFTRDNISRKAEDVKKGTVVLKSGILIEPQHIAVMASVGHMKPFVARKPRIGILSTGDELVEPSTIPGPSQIRNSNAYQLMAQSARAGGEPSYFGIVPDDIAATSEAIRNALENCDILLMSGGVSMGEFDFVPDVFKQIGIDLQFKTIAIQPGKPTVFGTLGKKRIFGLPGNPVSSFNLFILLVSPLIKSMTGQRPLSSIQRLPMGTAYARKKSERLSWIPVTFSADARVFPVEYHGSAHIHALAFADGIAAIEAGRNEINPGEFVDVRFI